ncbi:hypothetical protein Z517_09355 [Fonsecaea pedrosoi CBS 271.37]|uniref:Uncharacterized protein n=1 Tax=Fonsecaea pedrosoi CBS 271.37 TaxID=1442368 RepID=A0A0D2DGV3_9EURO|nr:uncharacterized protein Z517_09355 [Fonsecaea pedrosoi CBS 271.37]KIW76911.1 hypothetical protein Z517_09355 [Fonsecaea pedrosoi CBS 271.37]
MQLQRLILNCRIDWSAVQMASEEWGFNVLRFQKATCMAQGSELACSVNMQRAAARSFKGQRAESQNPRRITVQLQSPRHEIAMLLTAVEARLSGSIMKCEFKNKGLAILPSSNVQTIVRHLILQLLDKHSSGLGSLQVSPGFDKYRLRPLLASVARDSLPSFVPGKTCTATRSFQPSNLQTTSSSVNGLVKSQD